MANDRRIPLGANRPEEVRHGCGKHIVHGSERGFVRAVRILQCDEHRQHDEHAVFDEPFLRLLSEEHVLERWLSQLTQAAVHAGRVSLEDGAPRRVRCRDRSLRLGAKAMHANLAIGNDRARTNQGRKLAGGAPSRQIHLEESILRVQKAGGARNVFAGSAPDCRNAERVSRDDDRGRETVQPEVAPERRQTATKLRPHPDSGRGCAHSQHDRDREPSLPQSTTHRGDYGDYGPRPLF